jgi:hypothetical protein
VNVGVRDVNINVRDLNIDVSDATFDVRDQAIEVVNSTALGSFATGTSSYLKRFEARRL